ncbi:hypothetical protein OE88DRAFT_1648948 [Heliocybe sulcata]|uniref:Uncharacterized protein n=1 Tax=Heliocybe sulcata TaxID=5364 RepID=A0A5C3MPG0_9AGAM|nr:hypothetical protein OE88DRAFT_1648948 [Heliocybe sulcata]
MRKTAGLDPSRTTRNATKTKTSVSGTGRDNEEREKRNSRANDAPAQRRQMRHFLKAQSGSCTACIRTAKDAVLRCVVMKSRGGQAPSKRTRSLLLSSGWLNFGYHTSRKATYTGGSSHPESREDEERGEVRRRNENALRRHLVNYLVLLLGSWLSDMHSVYSTGVLAHVLRKRPLLGPLSGTFTTCVCSPTGERVLRTKTWGRAFVAAK